MSARAPPRWPTRSTSTRTRWSKRCAALGRSSSSKRRRCARPTTPPGGRARRDQGAAAVDATAPLAPTRAFARALLGGSLAGDGRTGGGVRGRGRARPADREWGLQKVFDERLAGAPERSILIRDADTGDPVRTLRKLPGREPRALRTSAVPGSARRAAERSVGRRARRGGGDRGAAVDRDILAVGTDRSTRRSTARWPGPTPPAEAFKVISTAALLRDGLDPGQTVACPRTLVVDGKTSRTSKAAKPTPPRSPTTSRSRATRRSSSSAPRLPASALSNVAKDYGVGRSYDLAVGTARSRVPGRQVGSAAPRR